MPHSDATNAYDLWADVCAVIEEEPLRYDQGIWGVRLDEEEIEYMKKERHGAPACHTTGCRAGWFKLLSSDDPATVYIGGGAGLDVKLLHGMDGDGAHSRLEVWKDNAARQEEMHRRLDFLFDGMLIGYEYGHVGTKPYAVAGAAGIREFMAEFELELRSVPIERKEATAR